MFNYKNTSLSVKRFYGVPFQPGETNHVPGFINDPDMIRVSKVPEVSVATSQDLNASQTTSKQEAKASQKAEAEKSSQTKKTTETKGGESEDGTDNNQ